MGSQWQRLADKIAGKLRVSSVPYLTDIAEGNVPDHGYITKFGHNSATGATLETVWDGSSVYTWPLVEAVVNVAANAADVGTVLEDGSVTSFTELTITDSAATFLTNGVVAGDIFLDDTAFCHRHIHSVTETTLTFHHENGVVVVGDTYRVVTAGGTGAAVIETQGVDGLYDSNGEFIVLNGITNVPSLLKYLRLYRVKVILVGSAGWNVGNVTLTGAALVAQITAQMNQTLMALWTVPTGKTAYLVGYYASTSTVKVTEIHLYVRHEGGPFQIKHIITLNASHMYHDFRFPLAIPQHSDVMIMASAAAGGGEVSAGFDAWYE